MATLDLILIIVVIWSCFYLLTLTLTTKVVTVITDKCIFYERRRWHLRDACPSSNGWKRSKNASTEIKKIAVNVRGKHVLYHYKTQHQPSQPALERERDWRPSIQKSSIIGPISIKKGWTYEATFWNFGIFHTEHTLQSTHQNSWPTCKYLNITHRDPEWHPVTNTNGILTNINMRNSTIPFM